MKYTLLFFLLLITSTVIGQTKFEEEILIPLQKNRLSFEKVYVQTNKTSYLPEDSIWFQAYVGNDENEPSPNTSRLHINLLNAEGAVVSAKNLFIEDGTGNGQFENLNLNPGTYFLQAYTQNLRNFGKETFYLQKLNVLGTQHSEGSTPCDHYEVQIFPEGGGFLENTTGTAAVKATKDGLGIDFSAEILDSKNQVLHQFNSVHAGMAKFKVHYKAGGIYTAVLKFKDITITRELPEARKEGVVLNLDNSDEKFLKINLKTNKNTLKSTFNGGFLLLCHQRNYVSAHIPFTNMDSLDAVIVLNKVKLKEGVNTITLFKNATPIAERKFFIEKRDAMIDMEFQKISPSVDFLRYKIKLSSTGKPVKASLSAAVFPENSEDFKERQNIESAFLLSPFINGQLENPAYYFDSENKNRLEHLDLALLSEKASTTSKKEFLAFNNPEKEFEPERGYSIAGEIKRPFLSNRFALISDEGELVGEALLNGNNRFKFDNLLLFKEDTLKFTFIDGFQFLKPSGVTIYSVESDFPTQQLPVQYEHFSEKSAILDQKLAENASKSADFLEGGNMLDEVLITGRKRSEAFLRRKMLHEKYKPLVWDIGLYYEIPISENLTIFNDDLMGFLQHFENVTMIHTGAGENYLSVNITKEAILFIDGKYVDSIELGSLSLSMSDVETIMRKPLGRGHRQYQIFTTENYKNGIKERFVSIESLSGYDRSEKYRSPIFTAENRSKFQEIDWKPNLKINADGVVLFSITKKHAAEPLLLNLEGFSDDGQLISESLYFNAE